MQGSELAKQVRAGGRHDLVIIGITADIYALDSRHQFLAAGMNGVLIKPLSLMALENELTRYFTPKEIVEEYSFSAFSSLLRNNPNQTLVILDEIKKVHDEVIAELKNQFVDEATFASLLHKIKGGAQLLNAKNFIQECEVLEEAGALPDRIASLIQLLKAQNRIIECYRAR